MFRQLFLIITCAVLLTACGGNNTATPAPVAQQSAPTTSADATNADATPSEIVSTQSPREYSTEEVQLPQPGTIIPPATQDPDAGKLFDSVALNRSGGITGKELNVEIKNDGTLIRDGATSKATTDQVKQISDALDQIGIFGMQGIFQAPGTSADMYTYRITVQRNGSGKTITAQEGFIPPQLADLIQMMSHLGSTS
ncbi:MAG: protealysin inhibitor emfourin [Chloroflexota bacterium]